MQSPPGEMLGQSAPKLCPLLPTYSERAPPRACLGESCQLWWFCRGPDTKEKTTKSRPPYPQAIVRGRIGEDGRPEIDPSSIFSHEEEEEVEAIEFPVQGKGSVKIMFDAREILTRTDPTDDYGIGIVRRLRF